MFEKPSTDNSNAREKKALSKKHALLGAAMIAGVGVSDAIHAEQNNISDEDWKAMYEALSPETRASIEKVRQLHEQAKPRRHIKFELDGKTLYEKNSGDGLVTENPDPNVMEKP